VWATILAADEARAFDVEVWIGKPFAHGTEHFELYAQLPIKRYAPGIPRWRMDRWHQNQSWSIGAKRPWTAFGR
jgi:hypothetical protein